MAKSSEDTPFIRETLRIGGWLPDSRQPAQLPAPHPDPVPDRWQRAPDASGQTTTPSPPPAARTSPGGSARPLVLSCLAVGVVGMLAFALAPLWSATPGPEQGGAAFVPGAGATHTQAPDPVSATGGTAFSPAPASLSTRASIPSPTHVAPSPAHGAPPPRQPTRPVPTASAPAPAEPSEPNLSIGAGSDGSTKADGTSYRDVRDGDMSTYWSPVGPTGRISIKWGAATTVSRIVIREASGSAGRIGSWRVVNHDTGAVLGSGSGAGAIAIPRTSLRKINFEITSSTDTPRVAEFETYDR